MILNSGDILNLSVALAVVAVALFLSLALYQLFSSLRKINRISTQVEKGVNKIDSLVDLIRQKVKSSSSYLFVLGKLANRAMDYFSEKSKKKKEEEKKNKTKKD